MKEITKREREVLHLIAYEHSSKEIASRLYVSYETIISHRKNIMRKLEVKNVAGMVRAGFEYGLFRTAIVFFVLVGSIHQPYAQSIGLQVDTAHNVIFGQSLQGPGSKVMWIPRKSALRAGKAIGSEWDIDSIGLSSTAFGVENKAIGTRSMVWGRNNQVFENSATAWGEDNIASETLATVWGENNIASDGSATAWGDNSTASGFGSTVWGNGSIASATRATAWGEDNIASGRKSTSWGRDNTASGRLSTTWGTDNIAQSFAETIIGRYADTLTHANQNIWESDDQLFVIGNGTSSSNRNNALTVLKNGNTAVSGFTKFGTTPPSGTTAPSIKIIEFVHTQQGPQTAELVAFPAGISGSKILDIKTVAKVGALYTQPNTDFTYEFQIVWSESDITIYPISNTPGDATYTFTIMYKE